MSDKRDQHIRQISNNLLRELSDRGQIIEGGWKAYELLVLPKDVSEIQRTETRKAFFCGAQHALSAALGMMDEGKEATEQDVHRLSLLFAELEAWKKTFAASQT